MAHYDLNDLLKRSKMTPLPADMPSAIRCLQLYVCVCALSMCEIC